MLDHRLRRWPDVKLALGQCVVFADMSFARWGSARWSDSPLVRQSIGPTVHWSVSPLNCSRVNGNSDKLPRNTQSICPTVHWSDTPLVRHIYWISARWISAATHFKEPCRLPSIVPTVYCFDSPLVFCPVWSKMPHKILLYAKNDRCSRPIHD